MNANNLLKAIFFFAAILIFNDSFSQNKDKDKDKSKDKPPITMDEIMAEIQGGRQYVVVLIIKGTVVADTANAARLQSEHLQYLFNLRNAGKISVFGPVLNNPNLQGLIIFNTTSLVQVQEAMDLDPFVKNKITRYEMVSWFGLPGATLPK